MIIIGDDAFVFSLMKYPGPAGTPTEWQPKQKGT